MFDTSHGWRSRNIPQNHRKSLAISLLARRLTVLRAFLLLLTLLTSGATCHSGKELVHPRKTNMSPKKGTISIGNTSSNFQPLIFSGYLSFVGEYLSNQQPSLMGPYNQISLQCNFHSDENSPNRREVFLWVSLHISSRNMFNTSSWWFFNPPI